MEKQKTLGTHTFSASIGSTIDYDITSIGRSSRRDNDIGIDAARYSCPVLVSDKALRRNVGTRMSDSAIV